MCNTCESVFCTYCSNLHFGTKSFYCPVCCQKKPKLQLSTNQQGILSQTYKLIMQLDIKIKCKNSGHGCTFTCPIVRKTTTNVASEIIDKAQLALENHEKECRACPKCTIKCKDCGEYLNKAEYEDHL